MIKPIVIMDVAHGRSIEQYGIEQKEENFYILARAYGKKGWCRWDEWERCSSYETAINVIKFHLQNQKENTFWCLNID